MPVQEIVSPQLFAGGVIVDQNNSRFSCSSSLLGTGIENILGSRNNQDILADIPSVPIADIFVAITFRTDST